jgi:hypothetical protein
MDWCANHGVPMTTNERCWGSPPPEGECERIRVWVIPQVQKAEEDND